MKGTSPRQQAIRATSFDLDSTRCVHTLLRQRSAEALARAEAAREDQQPQQLFLPGLDEHLRAMPNYLSRSPIFAPTALKRICDGTVLYQKETAMLKGWGKQLTEDHADNRTGCAYVVLLQDALQLLIAEINRSLHHHVQCDAQELLLCRNDRPQLLQSFNLLLHVHSAWRLSDGERFQVSPPFKLRFNTRRDYDYLTTYLLLFALGIVFSRARIRTDGVVLPIALHSYPHATILDEDLAATGDQDRRDWRPDQSDRLVAEDRKQSKFRGQER